MFQVMWYKLIVSEKKILFCWKAEFGTVSSLGDFLLDGSFLSEVY